MVDCVFGDLLPHVANYLSCNDIVTLLFVQKNCSKLLKKQLESKYWVIQSLSLYDFGCASGLNHRNLTYQVEKLLAAGFHCPERSRAAICSTLTALSSVMFTYKENYKELLCYFMRFYGVKRDDSEHVITTTCKRNFRRYDVLLISLFSAPTENLEYLPEILMNIPITVQEIVYLLKISLEERIGQPLLRPLEDYLLDRLPCLHNHYNLKRLQENM